MTVMLRVVVNGGGGVCMHSLWCERRRRRRRGGESVVLDHGSVATTTKDGTTLAGRLWFECTESDTTLYKIGVFVGQWCHFCDVYHTLALLLVLDAARVPHGGSACAEEEGGNQMDEVENKCGNSQRKTPEETGVPDEIGGSHGGTARREEHGTIGIRGCLRKDAAPTVVAAAVKVKRAGCGIAVINFKEMPDKIDDIKGKSEDEHDEMDPKVGAVRWLR